MTVPFRGVQIRDDHLVATMESGSEVRIDTSVPLPGTLRLRCASTPSRHVAERPASGLLQPDFHPALIAHKYEEGGAACLSVLTDEQYFQGDLRDLESARAAVQVPVLRKDFTIDKLQIFEAAAHGADAILLIAAILDVQELTAFRELATSLGLAALVEVHAADELAKAVDSGAWIIGVNNRDLQTFPYAITPTLSALFPPVKILSQKGHVFSPFVTSSSSAFTNFSKGFNIKVAN